jgi:hypothetical protein
MHVVRARNAHQALPEVMHLLMTEGIRQESRSGPVLKMDGPTTIMYERPCERVVFWPERDANPFFHVLESLWMLAGRRDVEFLVSILPSMADFSDNGKIFHGAYGFRWRNWFEIPHPETGTDQLTMIAEAMRADENCRRQVLQIWDANYDLGAATKDVPCNTHVYFAVHERRLDMTVCNRSNDAVWGALGANAVHFSFLQEYMAEMIGCGVGRYWQVTNNLHLYLDRHEELMHQLAAKAWPSSQYRNGCPYEQNMVVTTPLVRGTVPIFDADSRMLLEVGDTPLGSQDWFTRKIASPMLRALTFYKRGDGSRIERLRNAQEIVAKQMPKNHDWTMAAGEWLERRVAKWTKEH